MQEYLLFPMLFHRIEECTQVSFLRGVERYRNMNVLHSERSNQTRFVSKGIARIVMQGEVNDNSKSFTRH